MAYIINLTNGNTLTTISDGTINTTAASTLTLVGKNYAGYGQFLDTNFVRSLENSSDSSAPGAPLVGQLWWDSTNKVMKVYPSSGSAWRSVGAATTSNIAPPGSSAGDLWFDTANQQLKVYNSSNAYILVGPPFSSGQGITGAIPATVQDSGGNLHTVLQLYSGNSIVSINSADPTFTPTPAIPGFPTINPGTTMATTITNANGVTSSNVYFWGTATNALNLGGLPANSYITTGGNTSGNINTSGNVVAGNISTTGNLTAGNTKLFSVAVGSTLTPTGVNGEIIASNNITGFFSSDSKFKVNIQDIQDAVGKVQAIGGKTFDWTDEYLTGHGGENPYFYPRSDYGVIAQDVQAVFPTAVRTREDGSLALDYGRLSALAFAAIKELSARIAALEAR